MAGPGPTWPAATTPSRSSPDLVCDDQAPEERLVEPMCVLQRFDDGESRLDAEEHRGVADANVQIDQQRVAAHWANASRQVDGNGRGADAALGADDREHAAPRSAPPAADSRLIADSSAFLRERLGHALR